MSTPLVIEAAINGATTPAMQPHVPRTAPAIVADALACLEAGATIVHHHTDDMLLVGRHATEPYRGAWTAILASAPDAILYPTMGGGGPDSRGTPSSSPRSSRSPRVTVVPSPPRPRPPRSCACPRRP